MALSKSPMQSKIKRVKGLGAAKSGVGHWWLQRITAVALIPLTVWFAYCLISVLASSNVLQVAEWFASPVHSLLTILMLVALFWHAKLGMQVVIEDYVKSPFSKYTLLFANNFVCFVLPAVGALAVLTLHFLDVASSL